MKRPTRRMSCMTRCTSSCNWGCWPAAWPVRSAGFSCFVALLPFFFLLKMQKRERAWIICLTAMYFCVGILLTVLMNTTPDRQSAEENKVFFTASHAVVAIMIGYGLALLLAYMATHYANSGFGDCGAAPSRRSLGLIGLWQASGRHYFGPAGEMSLFELPHWIANGLCQRPIQPANLCVPDIVGVAVPFILSPVGLRNRAPILITLCLLPPCRFIRV